MSQIYLEAKGEEPELHFFPPDDEDLTFIDKCEITEDDVPTGDSVEDRRKRQKLILSFYHVWKRNNPE